MTQCITRVRLCTVQGKTELRCGNTGEDGVAIYARLVQLHSDPPNHFVRAARPYPAGVGSAKFQKVCSRCWCLTELPFVETEVYGMVRRRYGAETVQVTPLRRTLASSP